MEETSDETWPGSNDWPVSVEAAADWWVGRDPWVASADGPREVTWSCPHGSVTVRLPEAEADDDAPVESVWRIDLHAVCPHGDVLR